LVVVEVMMKTFGGKKNVFADTEFFIGVLQVEELVAAFVPRFCGADIHSSVHLERISVDDDRVVFCGEGFGK
jgi:hypothetical protein